MELPWKKYGRHSFIWVHTPCASLKLWYPTPATEVAFIYSQYTKRRRTCFILPNGFSSPVSNVCGEKQCSDTSWMSSYKTQLDTVYLWIGSDPTSQGFSPIRLPSHLQMPSTSSGCYLYFPLTNYGSEIVITPSLGSISLLEQLTELGEMLTNVYQLIRKDMVKDTDEHQMEEMWKARYVGRDTELLCPVQVCHPPSTSMCSLTRNLSEPRTIGIFMEASSYRHEWLIINFISALFSSQEKGGMALKVPSF